MSLGSLALRSGVLYVARAEGATHVRAYDLDGQPLSGGFVPRDPEGEPCWAGALAVDRDHRLWLPDAARACVLGFSLPGLQVARIGAAPLEPRRGAPDRDLEDPRDRRGRLYEIAAVAVGEGAAALDQGAAALDMRDDEEGPPRETQLLVGCGGRRRHAVHGFRPDGALSWSPRCEGEASGVWRGVRRIAARERRTWICESGARRIQVFRDGRFHASIVLPSALGARLEPVALAPLPEGRLVVATGGESSALLLLDRDGRLIRRLAEQGEDEGALDQPLDVVADVVADAGGSERSASVAVIDRDGERVQVFSLDGRCHGALTDLPGQAL